MKASTHESDRANRTDADDPNIVWFAKECRTNRVPIEALVRHAEQIRDSELAAFFRRAEAVSHSLAHAA